MSWMTVLG